jgi:toxin-antitoxin system PIN domain toxin
VRVGLDTNVLVAAHVPGSPWHEAVRAYLMRLLADQETVLVVTPLVLHELVHVVTDARRFEPVLSMSEALALARVYLKRSNVECLALDEEALAGALSLLEQHGLGRKRVADALLASTLLTNGVTELVTCNPADFTAFGELRITDPREPQARDAG